MTRPDIGTEIVVAFPNGGFDRDRSKLQGQKCIVVEHVGSMAVRATGRGLPPLGLILFPDQFELAPKAGKGKAA